MCTRISSRSVSTLPPGRSRLPRRTAAATSSSVRPWARRASFETSIEISYCRTPETRTSEIVGSEVRSSLTRFAISLRVRSGASPKIAISMTRPSAVSATTSGSSASTGKLVIRSMADLISSSVFDSSVPSDSSASTTPTFSEATLVTRSTPWMPVTRSSIRRTIACSTSSGDAPGYWTCTWIVSREISGKVSCGRLMRLTNPARMMSTMSRLAATPCLAIHAIARLMSRPRRPRRLPPVHRPRCRRSRGTAGVGPSCHR